jgi:hypothetical protein
LNKQYPKGKKEPDDEDQSQEDSHPNGDSNRQFFKNLINIPDHLRTSLSPIPLKLFVSHGARKGLREGMEKFMSL